MSQAARSKEEAHVGKRGIQSIDTAGKILKCMIKSPRPLMLKELSDLTGLPGGQLHAYLVSLKELGLVEQETGQSRYLLGPFALTLGAARMRSFDPLHRASIDIHSLAREHSLLMTVSVWDFERPAIVQVHRGTFDIQIPLYAGGTHPLLTSAAGLLFSAMLPEEMIIAGIKEELRKGYRAAHQDLPTTFDSWKVLAEEIRGRGYSILRNSPHIGLNAASFAVVDFAGNIRFTFTAIGMAYQFDPTPGDPLFDVLLAEKVRMSRDLGWQG